MLRGWVALTGTPGVGKSAVANRLRLTGVGNVDVGRLAVDNGLADEVDERRDSFVVDPRRVAPLLRRFLQKDHLVLLDGHWSHDVPGVTAAIVLRLHPSALRGRLAQRPWSPAKVRENVEAEAIDLILQEAVARLGRDHVFEVDTTGMDVDEVARRVYRIATGTAGDRRPHRPGRVDWSDAVLAGL